MNKERIKFFIKEVLIFLALIIILPAINAYIYTYVASMEDLSNYNENLSTARITVILGYLITPLTAKLPNFGKINRWWRFFIIYMMLS